LGHNDITHALKEAKELCTDPANIHKIAETLDNALKSADYLGGNIEKSRSVINSVSGYNNLISEKNNYGFMFLQHLVPE